jgi:hypothetical protein
MESILKKSLFFIAALTLASSAFSQTCNGGGACSPVSDNTNGQFVQGNGAIANGGQVMTGAISPTLTSTNSNAGIVGQGGSVGAQTMNGGSQTAISGGNTLTGGAVTGGAVTVTTVDTKSLDVAKVNADATRDAARELSDIKIRNTPSISAAALTSSNDTCMGSVSGGGSGPGLGLSFGMTYKDDNCVMLKNSREMWNMGFKAAAVALMCTNPANMEALEMTGYVCPQTEAAKKRRTVAATSATNPSDYTDPYVRARMGLAPLGK